MATVELTRDSFEDIIADNDTVIVDFWAEWCGPCKAFGPTFEKVSADHPDILFAKVNTEDEQQLASYFNIRSIPTLMVFRDQIGIYSQPGALPEPALRDLIGQAMALDMDEVRKEVEAGQGHAQDHEHQDHDHQDHDHQDHDHQHQH